MTIREFWRDVKGRLLEGRRHHEDRWYERGEQFGPDDEWRRDRGDWRGAREEYERPPWPRDEGYDEYRDRGIGAGPGIGGPEITSGFFDVNRADLRERAGSEPQAPDFRGLGPNIRRADDRIRDDVCELLTDDEDLDASEIEVAVADGVVVLTGTVSSRMDKRLAEDLSASVSGVRNVDNQLRMEIQ